MGHSINYFTFKESTSKNVIMAEVSRESVFEGDYHKPIEKMEWHDNKVFDTQEDAQEWIEQQGGFYRQIAVKFKGTENYVPSKTLTGLREKYKNAYTAYIDLERKFHFEGLKSATVSCKNCGSRIAKNYLHSNICPVCRTDLRPESTLKRISALREKADKLRKQVAEREKAEKRTSCKNSKTYWLVKIEYHV